MKLRKIFAGVTAVSFAALMAVSASAADAQGPDGQAGIAFSAGNWTAQNWFDGNEYATEVTTATVTGNGTYTVAVKAMTTTEDPDTGDKKNTEGTNGLDFAAVQVVNGETLFPGMILTIDSVKIDGVEVALSGTPYTSSDEGITTRVNLYNGWVSSLPDDARTVGGLAADATPTALDPASLGDWTTMEVTFTVSGAEAASAVDAATAGDTTAATTSTKAGSPDTGIADVAAVAGIAVVAAGALVVAKKRK